MQSPQTKPTRLSINTLRQGQRTDCLLKITDSSWKPFLKSGFNRMSIMQSRKCLHRYGPATKSNGRSSTWRKARRRTRRSFHHLATSLWHQHQLAFKRQELPCHEFGASQRQSEWHKHHHSTAVTSYNPRRHLPRPHDRPPRALMISPSGFTPTGRTTVQEFLTISGARA